jgi:hypothetical protein
MKIKEYTVLQFCLLFFGCETWSLALKEESRLGRGCLIIGCKGEYFLPKRDEVTGDWRKLHNEELNDLYSSHYTGRVIKPRRD